jgi:hypothetical protein
MSQPATPAEPLSSLDAIAYAHADQELYAPRRRDHQGV